jgi:hypothetical protein
MNFFLKKIFLFLISCFLIYITCVICIGLISKNGLGKNFVFPIGNYGHSMLRLREAKTHEPVDVLILGSSHAYRGFDPRIFKKYNIKIFNLGLSSETPIQSYFLLKKYYAQLQPKVVIQEIYPLLLENDGTESNSFLLANEPITWELTRLTFDNINLQNFNAWIYGGFRTILQLNNQLPLLIKNGEDTYIPGGYSQKDNVPFDTSKTLIAKMYEPRGDQLCALDSIKKFCNSKSCTLHFVITPITTIEKHHIQNWSNIINQINEIQPVNDFNRLEPLNDHVHFYDSDHLNQSGVEIFNPILINQILLKKN